MARLLAFDFGERRIGIAVSIHASPRPTALEVVANNNNTFDELGNLIAQYNPTKLIVGLPHNLDGEETAQSAKCRKFASQLEVFGLPVFLYDETLSSERAKSRLGLLSPKERKTQLDAMSAQIILEDYLRHATK